MDDVYTLSDGRRYISLCRTKTQNRCIIPLLPIAEEILSIVSGGRTEGLSTDLCGRNESNLCSSSEVRAFRSYVGVSISMKSVFHNRLTKTL